MRYIAGLLAATLILSLALPGSLLADNPNPKKYGIEFQFGGGYNLMQDLNDYVPNTANASFAGYTPTNEVNLDAQFGMALVYRHMEDFGWQFGYNRFLFANNFRIENSQGSWAEQSVVGSELSILATWFKPLDAGELFLGVGPGFYFATMDRSVSIYQSGSSIPTSEGTFEDAKGQAMGLIGLVGFEMMLKSNLGLTFQLGGRSAVIGQMKYIDENGNEQIVYQGGTKLPVDFTGGFGKITLRAYFAPSSDWRTPKR